MSNRPQINLGRLLNTLGSKEAPSDLRHRHALRRALMSSHYLSHPHGSTVWHRLFVLSGPIFVSGIAVGAFLFVAIPTLEPSGISPLVNELLARPAVELASTEEDVIPIEDAPVVQPEIGFVDFRPRVPIQPFEKFLPQVNFAVSR